MEDFNKKLRRFDGHIPPNILKENHNLNRFVEVLNGMLEIREECLDDYVRSFFFPVVSDLKIMRRYVDEWGAEYTESSTRFCIDCLYRNYHKIYSGKGTINGLKTLLGCLFYINKKPTIEVISSTSGKPLILTDENIFIDHLPSGEDLAKELNSVRGEEDWCPTLLGDSWEHHYSRLYLRVGVNYTPSTEFLNFIVDVLYKYIPMANKDFTKVNIETYII